MISDHVVYADNPCLMELCAIALQELTYLPITHQPTCLPRSCTYLPTYYLAQVYRHGIVVPAIFY